MPKKRQAARTISKPKTARQPVKAPARQALGRGLGALMRSTLVEVDVSEQLESTKTKAVAGQPIAEILPDYEQEAPKLKEKVVDIALPGAEDDSDFPDGLQHISLSEIVANKEQPRKNFKQEEVEALSRSIKESGVLQPILLRPLSNPEGGARFEIVAGERRFRAAKLAGLHKIPAVFRELSDKETLELGIVENVQRSDLNPIEIARAYFKLIEDYQLSQDEVGKAVGKDRVSIANALRLLKLPYEVQELISEGQLSAGHGRALLMLDSDAKRSALAKRVVKDKLSVRATEQLASGSIRAGGSDTKASIKSGSNSSSSDKSPHVLELEERLRRVLGTKVALNVSGQGSGELKISFFSKAELERLLEHLGVSAARHLS